MDVTEIRMRQESLERTLTAAIRQFEDETDVRVSDLSLIRHNLLNGASYPVIRMEVKL